MKKIIALLILFSAISSYGQDKGIGIRIGDLNGVSFKMYRTASDLEFSLGQASYVYDNFDYNDSFGAWLSDNQFSYTDIDYRNYNLSAPVMFQARMLFHKNLDKIADENVSGLKWYYGLGLQWRTRSIRYNYRYKVSGNGNWINASTNKIRDHDIGAEGIIGIEYTFDDAPVSLFLDINLFLEIIDDPLVSWFQGGIGARYRF